MKVAITGSHGLIGSTLASRLESNGDAVLRIVRGTARPGEASWDPVSGRLDPEDLAGVDAVVHLAGVGIGDHRWTAQHKDAVRSSRIDGTALIARTVASLDPMPALLSASAVGYYGDRGDEELDESSPPGAGFLASLCVDWEQATDPAERAGARVVHLRTGIVLSPAGGALKKQLPLFKFGVGGRLGSGKQYLSWISLEDEVGAIEYALRHDRVRGPLNLTGPEPVTNAAFTQALGRALHRPAVIPVPAPALKLVMGAQMTDEMLLSGARVLPRRLQHDGYRFAHPTLDQALQALLG